MVIFHCYVNVYQRVTLCAKFFWCWGLNSIGGWTAFYSPIPWKKRHGRRLFSTPHQILRYQQWEQTSRCSWHADGWRPIPGWCYQGSASRGTACCFWFPRLGWWESLEKSGSRSWGWKTSQIPMDPMVSGRCSTKTPKTDGFLKAKAKIDSPVARLFWKWWGADLFEILKSCRDKHWINLE